MSKFKAGDKVRLLREDRCHMPVGAVGTLTGKTADYWIMVMDDPTLHAGTHTQSESDLELVTEVNNNEEDTMSIQNDIINQNLSDNQEYLLRKGVINPDGTVTNSNFTLIQVLLAMNEDAVVAYMKAAEAKAEARRKGTVDEATPTGN